ncbi:MAG: alpha/beta fold hydrolase [Victivallaceae bacterium]|nr:alpha/beta fold hydrolase [Victivallaceae bacterium]
MHFRDLFQYFAAGDDFSRYPGSGADSAVLIHGWGVRAASMRDLAQMLRRCGYSVWNYDYPTARRSIGAHAQKFLAAYRREVFRGRIHILTHSMGGLVLRHALAQMSEAECRAIDAIVMLGPPNRGSRWGRFGRNPFVRRFNGSLGDMAPGSPAVDVPAPLHLPPVGIIAGSFDGKVRPEHTVLPQGMPFESLTVRCTHPRLRDPAVTGEAIRRFFLDKHF